jgi:hypothetical protein
MSFAKNATGGVDLARPKATPRWIIGAMVAITILVIVGMVVMWLVNQAKSRVLPMVPGVNNLTGGNSNNITGSGEVL